MAALIGALRVSLSAETAQFEAGMKRAQRTTQASASAISKSMSLIKSSVAGLAAGLSVGLFAHVIKGALDYAASLSETAQQLGVTTRELQLFRFAAEQNGATTEQADKALGRFSISMSKALAGSVEAKKAYKAVGVELEDLRTKTKTEILGKIADEMIRTGGASKNAAAGFAIFGKGFLSIIPTLDQGSKGMNALFDAAQKLGIVMDEELARKADEAHDKLDALATMLKAQLAVAVAEQTDGIMAFADAFIFLFGKVGEVISRLKELGAIATGNYVGAIAFANEAEARKQGGIAYGVGSVTMKLPPAKAKTKPSPDIAKFLSPSGSSGKKGHADHSAQDALRDAQQFDQDIRRAQMDVLRATQDLAKDYIERTSVGVQILNAEKEAFESELQYQTELYKLTKGKEGLSEAQASQLRVQNDIKDSLERQKLLQDEEEQRQRDVQDLTQHDFDRRRNILESQANIAETAEERRKVELELLKLAYDQKRQALENIEQTSKDLREVEDARRDLANLKQTYGNDKKAVEQGTRGPLETYLNELPTTAEKWNEALQNVAVDGLKSIEDGLLDILDGTKGVAEAFGDMARSIIRDLLKIAIRRFITAPLARALFGGFSDGGFVGDGYANGGFIRGAGSGTSDSIPAFLSNGEFVINAAATKRFLPLLETLNSGNVAAMARGGMAIPRHSAPHMAFAGGSFGGGIVINQHFSGNVSRETVNQIAARTKGAIASASRAGF